MKKTTKKNIVMSNEIFSKDALDQMYAKGVGIFEKYDEYKMVRKYVKDIVYRLPLTFQQEFKNALGLLPPTPLTLACIEAGYNHEAYVTTDGDLQKLLYEVSQAVHNHAMQLFANDEAKFGEWYRLVD